MPALPPYIPARDADFNNWITNFNSLLTASPSTYGLIAADATAVDTVTDAWVAAYTAAIDPSTRTPVTVQAKDDARIDAQTTVRPYAQLISLNPGVLSANKIAIGVNPRTSTPAPITAPTTNPTVAITAAAPFVHVLRYRDSLASPSVKSKPYGVIQVQIFAKVSATAITDPELLPLKVQTTKSPTQVEWSADDVGSQAYYAARWVTRTGLVGPWSPVVSFTVAA